MSLTWTAPLSSGDRPITDYLIQASTDGHAWLTVGVGVRTDTFVRLTELRKKTAYTIRIAAVTEVGPGPFVSVDVTTK